MGTTNRIVIAGGTGFLGLSLARHLTESGNEVVLLSRHRSAEDSRWRHVTWDARSTEDWVRELEGATALVNLAGRTVDCIKTPDHCDEILRSRVEATKVLGRAVREVSSPPPVWVQMSTAHRYGDPPDCVCDEDSAFGYGLAPFVAQEWEAAYARAVLPEMRQVILRTSFVMGRDGGALQRLVKLVRWGLGGTVGSGRQGMSWIHEPAVCTGHHG
ncbi:MAG: NAD-dependent epimerase/dehydratase family protein [Gimesia sp.]|nr:NAD-dependent epimerase/dehydratase family protein [Gimesia sp.]